MSQSMESRESMAKIGLISNLLYTIDPILIAEAGKNEYDQEATAIFCRICSVGINSSPEVIADVVSEVFIEYFDVELPKNVISEISSGIIQILS